jgi:glycosyltransferase involved in cell wall biosynthesis
MLCTQVCIQGIDPTLFHPRPFDENSRDRFVIFSGGKLEFRKGQDIVLEAVRRFRERHPETLLVCVWGGNSWLDNPFVKLFEKSPYLSNILSFVGDQRVDWCGLIGAFGMTRNHAHVYDTVENRILPQMMRKADVALFPNRCEGGTNMMAMQAMACGVPCILSANSGHMDIIQDGACLPLRRQRGVVADYPELSTEGWGESDVDEIVDALELIYRDREKARVIGAAGAHLMARHTWEAQIRELAPMVGL